jgi:hypothetical protein
MTTYNTIASSKEQTLVAATVDTLNFVKTGEFYEVLNRGATDLVVRFDGVDPAMPDGAGAGDNSILVLAGTSIRRQVTRTSQVKLKSSGTPAYYVEQL